MTDGAERPAARPRTVVVTGIAGRLGRIVARRLHRELDWRIVGLDRRPMPGRPKDIEHHQVDLRSKKARDVFRSGEVDALIHLGTHGTLEWLPGKALALSSTCWPETVFNAT